MKKITEVFVSWQGEGLSQGRRAVFIRFGGCNLRCKWCDTKYASYPNYFKIENWLSFDEVKKLLETWFKNGIRRFIFTGGEPMLFQNEIIEIMDFIEELFLNKIENDENVDELFFEIETNGTIKPQKSMIERMKVYNIIFNISPKPPYSQEKGWEKKVEPKLLEIVDELYSEDLVYDYIVKFIVGVEKDKEFVKQIQQKYNIPPSKIYIQPNCFDESCLEKMKMLLDWCSENNYNISPRLHMILNLK